MQPLAFGRSARGVRRVGSSTQGRRLWKKSFASDGGIFAKRAAAVGYTLAKYCETVTAPGSALALARGPP
eukprot:7183214-Prymnesium_polylepis.2